MAFIQKQSTALSFQGGLATKTDALQLQPPALLELKNGLFNKTGQLNKRYGYDILSTSILGGDSISSAAAIDSFNNELNLFDNQNIYTYIESNGNWANRGTAISLINTNNQIIRNTAQQLNPDSTVNAGLEFYVWEDSRPGGCRYSIVDNKTKAYVVADRPLYGVKPKTISFHNNVIMFHSDGQANLFYQVINTANPSIIGPQVGVFSDGYSDFSYDVLVDTKHDVLVVAYSSCSNNVPPSSIKMVIFNSAMQIIGTFTEVSNTGVSNGHNAVNLYEDSLNQLWLTWANGTNIKTKVFDASSIHTPLLPVVLDTTVLDTVDCATLAGIEYTAAGVLQLAYEVNAADGYASDQYIKSLTCTNKGAVTPIGQLLSVGLVTKPFKNGQNTYINVAHQSNLQSTYFTCLLNNEPFTIVGKVAQDVGGGLRTNNMLAEMSEPSTGVFIWANLIKGAVISEDNIIFSLLGVNSTTTQYNNVNQFNSVTQSNNLLFVGGILQSYDGVAAAEQNFHIYPEAISTSVQAGLGALSAGLYGYQVVYAWTDKFGQVQYSSPSPIQLVTCPTANCGVVLQIDTCRLTAKENVIIKVYRTVVNSGSPANYFEVTSEVNPLLNDPTTNYVYFVDSAADAAIQANGLIYTAGGVLPNAAPPSCSFIVLYQGRVVVGGLEDQNLLWYSKNKFSNTNFNTIPVEFSASLTIGVDPRGGPITSLAVMDSNLIIFKKNAIFFLSGDGPNDTGGGNQFPDPALIPGTVGCDNPNSIVLTNAGIMFQNNDKGIWLLDRSLNSTYIGQAVDDFNNQTVSSAQLDPNENTVIFTTESDTALVYDYYVGQWSTFDNHLATDATTFNNLYCFSKPNGQVYVQNRNSFVDGARPITMELTTPWMSWAGMQGWQRVFRCTVLGTYKGPHVLNVSVGYDFNNFFPNTVAINTTSLTGSNVWGADGYWGESTPWGSTYQPYQFQINFEKQTCQSLRIKISDAPQSPYNEGYAISSITFEVGVLNDNVRLPTTYKFPAQ